MPDFMDAGQYYNYRNMAFLSFVNGDENGGQPLYQNGDLMRTYIQTDSKDASQGYSWTWDNIVTWDRTFHDIHHLNLMGLLSAAYSNGESENLYYKNVMEGTQWWALGTTDLGYDYDRSSTGYS